MKTSGRKSLWRSTSNVVLSVLMGFGVCAVQAAPLGAEGWKKHVIQEGTNPMTAIAADFTGDGKVDVITNHGGKTWLLVAPDWREIEIDNRPSHSFIHSEVIDVDGDGDMDYIGARYSPGLIVWLENPQRPEVEPWPLHIVDDQVDGIHGVIVGDIDNDGTLDLLATSAQPKGPHPESLAWFRIPKYPTAVRRRERYIFADKNAPGLSHYLGVGDVNGDGRTDAASAAKSPPAGNWFAWWEAPADPRQTWKKHVVGEGHEGATNIHPVEVNGDGRVDFIASRGHGVGVVWFEAPSWKEHAIDASFAAPHCLVAVDLDADGDVDAASCGSYDARVAAWFENDGKGNFSTHIIANEQAAYDIRAIDIDSDGDLDILVAGQHSNNVVWYESPMK